MTAADHLWIIFKDLTGINIMISRGEKDTLQWEGDDVNIAGDTYYDITQN